jgi:hypothetical protein
LFCLVDQTETLQRFADVGMDIRDGDSGFLQVQEQVEAGGIQGRCIRQA